MHASSRRAGPTARNELWGFLRAGPPSLCRRPLGPLAPGPALFALSSARPGAVPGRSRGGGPLLPPCPRHSRGEWSLAVSLQSNNLVIHSVVTHFHKTRSAEGDPAKRGSPAEGALPHIVTCSVEHDSVRLPLERLVEERVAGE